MMITLIIEARARPRTSIEVDDSMVVGSCVAFLVEKLGYPKTDAAGRPMRYQLRLVEGLQPLPNRVRFSDAHIHSGTRVVLEAEEANNATVPVETPGLAATRPAQRVVSRRFTRRSVIIWTLVGFSVAGMGAGITTAFARASLSVHSSGTSTPVTPGHQPFATTTLRGANLHFTFEGHQQQTVRVVGWSPDGTMLASGGDDAQVIIWGPTGNVQQRIAHPAAVQALTWSPESERVMTGSGTQVAFFKALTGTLLARSTHQHAAAVASVAWTPNNQKQAISGGMDKQAVVWETTNYQPQIVFTRHTAAVDAVSWGSDGQTVASASQGGVVRVWNAESGQEVHGFYQDAQVPMRACAFAPAGSSLAIGGNDGIVRVWNGFLCQQQQAGNDPMCQDTPLRLKTSNQPIRSLAWSPDARYLASGSDDGSFTVWSPAQSQIPLFTVTIAEGIAVHGLAWSPGGDQIAAASGGTVTIWNVHA